MKTGIIMPTYGQPKVTARAIKTLYLSGVKERLGKDVKLVVVNDGYPYKGHEKAQFYHLLHGVKGVEYIDYKQNKGFTYAVNKGYERCKDCQYILLVNNDVLFSKNFLEKMERVLDTIPKLGAVVPLTNPTSVITQSDIYIHPFSAFINLNWGINKINRVLEEKFPMFVLKTTVVTFFCCLIKRETLPDDEIHPYEAYPDGLYGDVEYSYRTVKNGYALGVLCDTYVYHAHRKTIGKLNDYNERIKRGAEMFVKRNGIDPFIPTIFYTALDYVVYKKYIESRRS